MNLKFWKLPKPSPNGTHDGFTQIYSDNKGNKWYMINNQANLHATRALSAWTYSRDAEFGLNKEKLSIACEKIDEAVNKKDLASISKVVGVIQAALTMYAEPNILLNLATCYTFLNDEKNDSFQDTYQEKKRAIWEADVACKAFFLQWSVQFIPKFSGLQSMNVPAYLAEVKPVLDQIDFQLRRK